MKKLTKTQKQNVKRKIFKISAILSFIFNGLFILMLVLGLCLPKDNGNQSNPSQLKPLNSIIRDDTIGAVYPTTILSSMDYEYFRPYNYDDTYTINGVAKTHIQYEFLDTTRFGRSFDFMPNHTYIIFAENVQLFQNDSLIYTFNGGISISYQTSDKTIIFKTVTGQQISTYYASSCNYKIRIFNVSYVEGFDAFVNYFYYSFGGYSIDSPTDPNQREYFLKPYFSLNNFEVGKYYPINWVKYDLVTNVNFYTLFYIDFDNSVYLYSTNNATFNKIGARYFDSKNNPFFKPILSTDFSIVFDNFYRFDFLTSIFIDNEFIKISRPIEVNQSGDRFVYLQGEYFFQWLEFGSYTTIADFIIAKYIDLNFSIKNIDNIKFNKMFFAWNNVQKLGGIQFLDSANLFMLYKWSEPFNFENIENYWLGDDYGLNISYPFAVTINIDSFVSEDDFKWLGVLLVPVDVRLDETNIFKVNQNALTNVFDLFKTGFEGLSSILNIQIFSGITLLGLLMVPLVVLLIITIVKLIKG